jgi:hypothetical protein
MKADRPLTKRRVIALQRCLPGFHEPDLVTTTRWVRDACGAFWREIECVSREALNENVTSHKPSTQLIDKGKKWV